MEPSGGGPRRPASSSSNHDQHLRPSSASLSPPSQHHLQQSLRQYEPLARTRSSSPEPFPSAISPGHGGVEQLDPLSRNHTAAASIRSRLSARSSNRPRSGSNPNSRAESDPTRQPSIRIRRLSVSTPQLAPEPPSTDRGYFQGYFQDDAGRPRSISQPERARLPPDAGTYARQPRRAPAPELAMPRLTEEGPRPTLDELEATTNQAAYRSGPQVPFGRGPTGREWDDVAPDDDANEPNSSRLQRFRRPSMRFLPGFARGQTTQPSLDASTDAQQEYDEALVNWLDTIGMCSYASPSRKERPQSFC